MLHACGFRIEADPALNDDRQGYQFSRKEVKPIHQDAVGTSLTITPIIQIKKPSLIILLAIVFLHRGYQVNSIS